MAGARKPHVLVVDDEPSVLVTYQMILEQQGYQVSAVGSSVEAKRLVEEPSAGIDLLLCDLSLEQRHTGFEVIEAAHQRHPEMPSVLLTGYASADIAAQAEGRGVRVLFKPIDIQEFLSTISELLRQKHERQKANGQ
jgi:DNA-binding NtrC family response regulator